MRKAARLKRGAATSKRGARVLSRLDFPVIVGKSEIGQMLLYREDDDSDFVFTVTYIGGALKTEKYAHWHPNDSAQAFEDTKAFMTDDRKYFLQFGLSL